MTFKISLTPAVFLPLLLLPVLLLAGCRTGPPIPPADLGADGWQTTRGQAVWRRNHQAPELAGEILFATQSNGRTFVQFSKNPFPLIVAQRTPESWEVQIPVQNRTYSGRGRPPGRLFWLAVPWVLQGEEPPPKGWAFRRLEANRWRFENRRTGEFLEGFTSR